MTSYLDYDGLETLVGEIKDWTAPRGLYLEGGLAVYGSNGETDFGSATASLLLTGYAYGDPFVETGNSVSCNSYGIVSIVESGTYLVRAMISNSIADQQLAFGTSDGTYDYDAFAKVSTATSSRVIFSTFVAEIEAGQYIAVYAQEESEDIEYTGTAAVYSNFLLEVERLGDEIETARIYRASDSSTAGGGTTGM